MDLRRIVTGHDQSGKSVVVNDGRPPRSTAFESIPGMCATLVWATEQSAPIPRDGADPTPDVATFLPAAGATRLLIMQFPPDSVFGDPSFDPAAAGAENLRLVPGVAESFEIDAPGMHTTLSVDYGIVLEGEPVLELDDGVTRVLRAGDIVVQNGTRHAWRNPTDAPTTIAFVLVGATH